MRCVFRPRYQEQLSGAQAIRDRLKGK